MFLSTLSLTLAIFSATPVSVAPEAPHERQIRSVWMPPDGGAVEVFVGVFSNAQWDNTTAVDLPAPVKRFEAEIGALVRHEKERSARLHVTVLRAIPTGPGLEVRVTLADDTRLSLRLVTRPQIRDVLLNVRKRPAVDPEERARLAQERFSRCESLGEMVVGKARLIAERGADAVINRVVGDGSSFKQNNLLSIAFLDVVHDAGISYATLVIKNRSRSDWPVNLEKVMLSGPDGDVRIIARASELAIIPPRKGSRVVLAYETPSFPSKLLATVQEPGKDLPSLYAMVIP